MGVRVGYCAHMCGSPCPATLLISSSACLLLQMTVKWDLLESGERRPTAQWSEEDPGLPIHRCSSTIMAMSEPARGCTTLRGSLRLTVFAKKEVVKKHKLVRIRVAEVALTNRVAAMIADMIQRG